MVFASGNNRAAFARFCGPPHFHVDSILERNFDQQARWSDGTNTSHSAVWTGEYDTELAKLCSLLPGALDSQPMQLQKRLSEMFPALLHLLQTKDSEAARLAASKDKDDEEEKKRQKKEEKTRPSSSP